jgi:uncharacterized membrane protein
MIVLASEQEPGMTVGPLYVIVTAPQASVAVGVPGFVGMLLHCTVTFPGTKVNTGGVSSTLLTVNEQVAVLPFPSFAVSVTVIAPAPLTVVPAAGVCVTVTVAEQPSEVVAEPV